VVHYIHIFKVYIHQMLISLFSFLSLEKAGEAEGAVRLNSENEACGWFDRVPPMTIVSICRT
jgi:hypothetical protein